MLDREEIKEFTGMRDDNASFVSLYLNVDPISNPKGDYIIRFKNMIRDTAEGLEKAVYKLVKDDLIKMESYVTGNKRMFKKGLVLLSSSRKDFWREYHLAVPVRDEIVVEKSPYMRPLLDALDHYQRFVIALVDKESARIFIVHLGEIVEYGEVHTSDVPGRHKKGGWFALSQNHYDRHIKFHVGLHLNDVVKKLDSFMAGKEVSGLLMGGSDEAVVMTKGMLAPTVSAKIVGSFQAEMSASSDDILARAEAEIDAYEEKKKDETVELLVTQALKNENAVLGLENVLNALHEGKVMKLIFLRDYKSRGYCCEKCGSLGFQNTGRCAYCRGELRETNFIVDMAAQKAVGQGASVEVVPESRSLGDSGGIGAFLRF